MYIFIEGLSVTVSCFLMVYSSGAEYDPSGNSNSLLHFGADILNLLFLYDFFYIFPCIVNAKVR